MTIRISLFLLLWCCFAFQARPADSSTNANEPVVTDATAKDITLAFGFYLGQILSLEAIEQKFPKLAAKAQIAKRELETSYSPSIEKMDTFASSRGNGWEETKRELRNMIVSKLADQAFSLSSAEDFIDLAGKKAKGDIPSPIIETLLTFYHCQVANESREAGLKESFETFEPLFRLVANSLVIQKQGKARAP